MISNPKPEAARAPGARPLDGIVIADFSRVLAGPYATMLLADMGAEVIKVESPGGDDTRSWLPPVRPDGVSTYYSAINRNKKSVVLNLKDEDDLAAAKELAARADVMIENFKPGGLKRFGLDYSSVRERNKAVIYCSISGFGTAEGAALPGYDLIVQAMSGLMSLTGDPNGEPYRAGISVFDVMAGLHSTIGILAALHHRDRTGEGQNIETSLMASAMSGLVNQTSAYVAGNVTPFRMGNAHPSLFPYEALPTKDDDLIITAGNNAQFRKLCAVLDVPELADDKRFADNADRTRHREKLRPLLVERLKTRTAEEWFEKLNEAGVPTGPINTIKQGVEYAQKLGLQPVVQVGAGAKTVPGVRNPITFSATPARYELAPPELGEHTDEIRAWLASAAVPTASTPGAS
ncbi:Succinyl-CoA:(R)-benzylsuccinate CoA-transferase subunit BbsF [Arthrobacter ulcerisalmonis]|uniref:Succinyl-CoA:(R)-benzylsuccinate CoA-transferase subunit BbsF n=1 Tax=Arthrobacter ulcerisalmonis TaxID=2483813 RepID=A0A3P5WRG5_9MICC|nr:CoA transferase [Arthrobacter ulcerisalmonis]VDC18553.1 Succinyl-CoA:(R)-benzylsuccinate CoA-transferase subunit BbsF [Arthrobacter ulcerisalmonis]